MSFWDHLDVLRGTIFRSVGAILGISVIFLCIKEPFFRVILWPSSPDFILYKWLGLDFSMDIINIEVSAQFFVHLKMAVLAGVVVAFPYVVWEIWRFIEPALYDRERKPAGKAFLLSSGLFYLGVAVGYFIVLPVCLIFFMNYSVSEAVTNSVSLSSYISMFISMVFLIGLVFEFPTVVMILSGMGLLDRNQLRSGRKYAVVVILILSALITPSDPVSMVVLAVPLYGLYEFSILVAANNKTDNKQEEEEVTDDIGQ